MISVFLSLELQRDESNFHLNIYIFPLKTKSLWFQQEHLSKIKGTTSSVLGEEASGMKIRDLGAPV